jgi:lipopolysaccharide transport system permease protein
MNQQQSRDDTDWTEIISSESQVFNLKLSEIWRYRDLCYMFVKRDLVTQYKQTIFGPLWYIVQPLLTTIMFTIIFSRIARISTNGVPPMLFYLAGLTIWNYFSQSLASNSTIFIDNQQIFGKVYFPRMVVCISAVLSNLIKFGIQFILFIAFYFYFYFEGANIHLNYYLLLIPIVVVIAAGLSLGFSTLFSAFTTKYRDLKFLLTFGVQLWMYATPIIYPLSNISEKHRWILVLNPMTSVVTTFKYAFLGNDVFDWYYLLYSFIFMVILLIVSVAIFNKVEKNFMDTV